MEGPGADSGEKHEPARDIDTAVVDSLKVLDPNRPIREADISSRVAMSADIDGLSVMKPSMEAAPIRGNAHN